jgi:hypothetical protein
MTRTRSLVPIVVAVGLVLLGVVAARVVAQEDAPQVDYSPVTVPTSTGTPRPTLSPTPSPSDDRDDEDDDRDDDDDDYERVPQTPRPIDASDDDRDDDRDDDDDD